MEYEHPPKYLYRYEKVNHYNMGNLLTSRFFLSPPKNFNDPFDCSIFVGSFKCSDEESINLFNHLMKVAFEREMSFLYSISNTAQREEMLNKYKTKIEKEYPTKEDKIEAVKKLLLDNVKQTQNEYLEKKGVVCFSETFENILMWSHYTDGHRGYCIEFDTTHFSYKRKERFYKVAYCDKFPSFKPAQIILNFEKIRRNEFLNPQEIFTPIFTKSKHWEYEK
jgi:hypothetical protein